MSDSGKTTVVFFMVYWIISSIIAEQHLKRTNDNPVLWYIGGVLLAAFATWIGYFGVIPMVGMIMLAISRRHS